MKDLLQDNSLKKMPYSTPEGYFDSLKAGLKTIPQRQVKKVVFWKRYVSIAAAVALLLAAGGIIYEAIHRQDSFTEEDYIVFSDDLTNTLFQEYADQYAEAQHLTEDDIIEYLIYSGIGVEEIEQY